MKYYHLTENGYSCCGCGKTLHPGDKILDCAECAGIFCKSCVEDGTFKVHECEPDDIDEE